MNRLAVAFVISILVFPSAPSRGSIPRSEGLAIEPATSPVAILKAFLHCLEKGKTEKAHSLLVPVAVENVAPVVVKAPLDFKRLAEELDRVPHTKFGDYELGEAKFETPNRCRVKVVFGNGDSDQAVLVRENQWWYLANPVHLIR